MSTLYIRLPSKAAADHLPDTALDCQFALASDGGAIEREGSAALNLLGETVAAAQKVVLLLAASDVTLLQVTVPPMSASRLKAALPNLVEEQLMSDPADCLLIAGPSAEGLRTVAVVNRAYLGKITQTLIGLGARSVAAVPSQLCLPYQPETVSAAIAESGMSLDIEVAIRLSDQTGMGLSLLPEQPELGARDAVETVCTLAPQAAIALYVPQARVATYQQAVAACGVSDRIQLFADNWSRWIAGAKAVPFNMTTGLGAAAGPSLHWRQWRWPLVLASLVLLVNIIGLNVEWLRLKREATALRSGMVQTYKSIYPKETAIIDPIAQMRQKITAAQHDAGQAAPDDFIVLAAHFGEAWQNVMQGRKTAGIAAIEYNERTLQVRLKPEGEAPTAQMQTALAARNLSLTQKSAGVWQIRSAK